jgi:hypothetical protein
MRFNRRSGVDDWVRRLGWLCLWLVARHSMRLWLTAPPSRAKWPDVSAIPLADGRLGGATLAANTHTTPSTSRAAISSDGAIVA